MSMSDEVCKHQSTFGPRDIYQSKFNIYSHEMRFHEVDIEATNHESGIRMGILNYCIETNVGRQESQ